MDWLLYDRDFRHDIFTGFFMNNFSCCLVMYLKLRNVKVLNINPLSARGALIQKPVNWFVHFYMNINAHFYCNKDVLKSENISPIKSRAKFCVTDATFSLGNFFFSIFARLLMCAGYFFDIFSARFFSAWDT